MILKKPYAFLIKYFKLINLILAVLSGYIAYKTYNIINFFNNYIIHNYSGNFYKGFSNTYISSMLFFAIILIIVGILVIYLLLIYKKKPSKAYLTCIIYYVILIIFLNIIKNVMITLETNVITAELARIYRDLSLIGIIPQTYFILLFLLRGLGFNIGKFNFKEDIKELEISEKDSEEVEITFKGDDVKLKRNIRRFGREFTYYIKENKFIFTILCIIIAVLMIFFIYKSLPEIIDKEYKQGDIFTIGSLTYKIEDSILTNIDYKGKHLEGYYLVVKLNIENNINEEQNIDYNDFRIEINDRYIYPTHDKGKNFIDYAPYYTVNKVKANAKQTYTLVFKINENEVKNNYEIKINNGSHLLKNTKIGKFIYVTITPAKINKVALENAVIEGMELSFINSNLRNSKLTLSNSLIVDKYIYTYEQCSETCNTYKDIINLDYTKNDKLLLVLDYNYVMDKNASFYKQSSQINKFIESFVKIKYKANEKEKISSIKNVTPVKLIGKIVLEVPKEIKDSKEVYIQIVIRNKEYLVKLN